VTWRGAEVDKNQFLGTILNGWFPKHLIAMELRLFFVSECTLLAVSEAGPALTSLLNGMRHLQDPAEIWGITNHMTISKSCACLDGLSPSVNRTIVDDLDLVHPNE